MRTIENFTGFLSGMLLAAALFMFMLPKARGADAPIDLPKEVPLTATLFYSCEHTGKPEIVALVVSFQDGQVIRIDADHMHGIPNAQYVAAYGDMAADKKYYGVGGCGQIKT